MLTSFLRPDAPPPSSKTDEELRERIDNRENYLPETVLNAVAELQRRGHEFSEEELQVINEDMQARMEIAGSGNTTLATLNDNYKNALVEDPDAYEFYSRRVVRVFTFFFGAVFGSIMMAINIQKTKNFGGVALVLLFGFGTTFVELILASGANLNASASILFSIINSYLIDLLFWNNYIGNSTLYTARKYWAPLIIGLLLAGFVVWSMFQGKLVA
ncbi:MAG TPA: hypothetical protein VJ844_03040 [Mucilaginibacter sp.]|nr:hypothetical protein [Mucilaginibacter sp.]